MNAAKDILDRARFHGLEIEVRGDRLKVRSTQKPPDDLLTALKAHKLELIALLKPANDDWSAEDWHAFFDERAAIGGHDGGLDPPNAEAQAFESCISEWINQHPPEPTGSERCAYCGQAFGEYDGLPYRTEGGHVWLHDTCHAPWSEALRAEAARALMEVGVV